jgi:hypothetical protein
MSVELVTSSREACAISFHHFLDYWAFEPPLLCEEEMEIYLDNFPKEGNVLGGSNWYRANLSVNSDPSTQLDITVSDVPITFLHGMGDPVDRNTRRNVAAWRKLRI